jgi:hypothetical protein
MYEDLPSIWAYVRCSPSPYGFHVWLVYLRPLPELTWRKVDYIWLGFSVFAIVAAASQLRIIVASEDLARTNAGWVNQTSILIDSTTEMRPALGCQRRPPRRQRVCLV